MGPTPACRGQHRPTILHMGNSSSRRSSQNSKWSSDKKTPYPPTDPYTIGDGLTMFHAGWRVSCHTLAEQTAGSSTPSTAVAPPPPYTASDTASPKAVVEEEEEEDALELLRKYNIVFVVDDSLSMGHISAEGTRWEEAGRALAAIADIAAKYDTDGIDLHFLNNKVSSGNKNLRDAAAVRRLFARLRLKSSTPIGEKIEELLLPYIDHLEATQAKGGRTAVTATIKPINFIVITDGHPTDDPESVIVAAAKRLDQGNFPLCQVGIQFVQIGDSRSARQYLEDLDSHLHGREGIRDIIDTTPYTGRVVDANWLIKILLGGINRRVDREHAS